MQNHELQTKLARRHFHNSAENHVKFDSQTTSNGLSDSWHTRFLLL